MAMNDRFRKSKILYVFDAGDAASRIPVARQAQADGHDVTLLLLGKSVKHSGDFRVIFLEPPEGKLTPKGLLYMVAQIRSIITAQQPDLVHAVTLKYAFICGLAEMAFPDLKKIYTLAGLGYLFRDNEGKAKLLRAALSPFLKLILKNRRAWVIFQNPDDQKLMTDMGYTVPERSVLIRGSGVDLQKFSFTSEPKTDTPIVLMPTRLVRDKGISVFIEAARLLKLRGSNAVFQIAGGVTQHNPKAISESEMKALVQDGSAQWLGRVDDMPALLSGASMVVYPSYYGEGIPRVLLEACAAGRAIVTTDHPGCREAVRDGENGILVPAKDVEATAKAIEKILQDPALRLSMGARSRTLAEERFDIRLIAQQTCDLYKQILK